MRGSDRFPIAAGPRAQPRRRAAGAVAAQGRGHAHAHGVGASRIQGRGNGVEASQGHRVKPSQNHDN